MLDIAAYTAQRNKAIDALVTEALTPSMRMVSALYLSRDWRIAERDLNRAATKADGEGRRDVSIAALMALLSSALRYAGVLLAQALPALTNGALVRANADTLRFAMSSVSEGDGRTLSSTWTNAQQGDFATWTLAAQSLPDITTRIERRAQQMRMERASAAAIAATTISLARSLPSNTIGIVGFGATNATQAQAQAALSLLNRQTTTSLGLVRVRVATLDTRTCLACVALHGTLLADGEDVVDHPRGRCSSVYVRPSQLPQSGIEWFGDQTAEAQQKQMGKAAWRAWQDGRITISDLAEHKHIDIDGQSVPSVNERSLVGLLGADAARYKS